MKDREGRTYLSLPTAFKFRNGLASGCACKAQPWDEASAERHHMYELQSLAQTGDETARTALDMQLAIADVRRRAPDPALAQLGVTTSTPPNGESGKFAFGPPVVAPLDDAAPRAPAPLRYAGQLQPLSVVLDATGSPVRRQPARSAVPVKLTVIAGLPDHLAANQDQPVPAEPNVEAPPLVREIAAVPEHLPAPSAVEALPKVRASTAHPRPTTESQIAKAARGIKEARVIPDPVAVIETEDDESGVLARELASAKRSKVVAGKLAEHKPDKADKKERKAVAAAAATERARQARAAGTANWATRKRYVAHAEPDWKELLFRPY